jgi:hypothetical protein
LTAPNERRNNVLTKHHRSRSYASLVSVVGLALLLALAGCSGGGGDGGSSGSGTMQVRMIDATGAWQNIFVTISGVKAVPADGPIQTLSDTEQTFDVLALTGGVDKLIGTNTTLPAGTYNQIRLMIKSVDAVDSGGVHHAVTVPSGAQTGLKLVGPFTVGANTVTTITLDFDAAHSIVVTGGPSPKYLLKPVIKVVATSVAAGRITGKVLDADSHVIVPASGATAPTISAYPPGKSTDPTVPAVGSTTASTTDGTYTLDKLPVGSYDVVYSADGFTSQTVSGVVVTEGTSTTVPDVKLVAAP